MIESLILIEGKKVSEENLRISLANAKQLIIGKAPGFGVVIHIAANSPDDLRNALIDFAKIKNVKGVDTLVIRSSQ